jgi:starch phosphorylase
MNLSKKHYGTIACGAHIMEIDGFEQLASLAMDLRWSWNDTADDLWEALDPALWEQSRNPWLILQTVSGEQLQRQLNSPSYRARLDDLIRAQEEEDAEVSWMKKTHPDTSLKTVAYFSMEFMLSEALPIYVGGLGNVAGDQLKSASDLGVPVVGVGMLYQRGYFRQFIDEYGTQQAYKPYNDPGQLPITPLRLPNGEWLRIEVQMRGRPLWIRAWEARVGRVRLILLDTNDSANLPEYREITGETYGGGSETRIMQELVLGIGGWRILEQLGITPEVCHLNEGHAAFAVLERARSYMEKNGESFDVALAVTRAGNLFTTHTAVAAGFDLFEPALVTRYLGDYAQHSLKISLDALLALGRQDPLNPYERFNMAYLAVHGSRWVNGVSQLHGRVSRHLFEPLFLRWPTEEVPVGHITNGVHMPSWESDAADRLWTDATFKHRWKGTTEVFEAAIKSLPDEKIWNMRNEARADLINYIRQRSASMLTAYGAPEEAIEGARKMFDPNVLTIGFARRFVSYKRPDLLLEDPARLTRLLTNYQQPVQLVIAGKAPPTDQGGVELIRRWIQYIHNTGLSGHVVFLPDYDMLLASHLVGGMDVWLNTPQRPWEASGTSGMKVLVNGGLNLSELDGWWVEAYRPELGWALGDGLEHGYDPALDKQEAEALFAIIEQQVAPEFYHRNGDNLPKAWVDRVRMSMSRLTPYFNSHRTVRDYAEKFYMPAAELYHTRSAHNSEVGRRIVHWKTEMDQQWPWLRFGQLTVTDHAEEGKHRIEAEVFVDKMDVSSLSVEVVAGAQEGGGLFRQEMQASPGHAEGWMKYSATVPDSRPAGDYTPRIVPKNADLAVPLEYRRILWQH